MELFLRIPKGIYGTNTKYTEKFTIIIWLPTFTQKLTTLIKLKSNQKYLILQ
jgi:hypothetical protein